MLLLSGSLFAGELPLKRTGSVSPLPPEEKRSAAELHEKTTRKELIPPEPTLPEKAGGEIVSFFRMLEKESPHLVRRQISKENMDRGVRAFFESLGVGIHELPPPGKTSGVKTLSSSPAAPVFYPPVPLENGTLLYLRLASLSADSAGKMLREISTPQSKACGLILDLRQCSGGTPEGVGLFMKWIRENRKGKRNLPFVLLIGPGTSGAAEVLVRRMIQAHAGISLGGTTAGEPYGIRKIMSSGRLWRIPVPPECWGDVPYLPVVPAIRSEMGPSVDYETLKKEKTVSGDSALRRAVDLLLGLESVLNRGTSR